MSYKGASTASCVGLPTSRSKRRCSRSSTRPWRSGTRHDAVAVNVTRLLLGATEQCEGLDPKIPLMKSNIRVNQIDLRTKTQCRCAQLPFTTVLTMSFIALTTPAYCICTFYVRYQSTMNLGPGPQVSFLEPFDPAESPLLSPFRSGHSFSGSTPPLPLTAHRPRPSPFRSLHFV